MFVLPQYNVLRKLTALNQLLHQNPNPPVNPKLRIGVRAKKKKKNPNPKICPKAMKFGRKVQYGKTNIFPKFDWNRLKNIKVINTLVDLGRSLKTGLHGTWWRKKTRYLIQILSISKTNVNRQFYFKHNQHENNSEYWLRSNTVKGRGALN